MRNYFRNLRSIAIHAPFQNTVAPGDPNNAIYNGSTPLTVRRFGRRIELITDGSSNTIAVGQKAMATQVIADRGTGQFTMTNGTLRDKNDDPIAFAGPAVMGLLRGNTPDNCWYMAENPGDRTLIQGGAFGLQTGWTPWFLSTFQLERDARDLDTFNRWGSPYSGGTLFGMADGSVRNLAFSTAPRVVANLITPTGGETISE